MMREAPVEQHLVDRVKELDGRCVKLSPVNNVGIPDRLVILPGGVVVFVELKRPRGGVVSRKQSRWHEWLSERGHEVAVLSTKEAIDGFIREIRQRLGDRED